MSEEGTTESVPVEVPAEPRSGSRRLLDRLLPLRDRAAALWFAAGAAVVSLTTMSLQSRMAQAFAPADIEFSLSGRSWLPYGFWVLAAGIVLLVALVMWLVLRYTRAPRVLALFLVLSTAASAVVRVVGAIAGLPARQYLQAALGDQGVPGSAIHYAADRLTPAALDLLLIGGVLLGAWLAAAMRDPQSGRPMGFGEFFLGSDEIDDEELGVAETIEDARPAGRLRGIRGALGWEGWHAEGPAGFAIGVVSVELVASLVALVLSTVSNTYYAIAIANSQSDYSSLGSPLVGLVVTLLSFVLVVYVYYRAVRRHGVSPAVWLVAIAGATGDVVLWLTFLPGQFEALAGSDGGGSRDATFVLVSALLTLITLSAPLTGAWLAVSDDGGGADSDTLPAEG